MDMEKPVLMVLISAADLAALQCLLQKATEVIEKFQQIEEQRIAMRTPGPTVEMIRPEQFMAATGIRRTKFDTLIAFNQIEYVKKGRKIHIPITQIDRYFNDPSIQ